MRPEVSRKRNLVRYVGWYSNRARGERAKKASLQAGVAVPLPGEAPATEFAARARAAWAKLIRKVYEGCLKQLVQHLSTILEEVLHAKLYEVESARA